jgi:hypothetical protein
MNSIELLQEYPKAATVVKQWMLNQLLESLKDDTLPEDFKENVRQIGIDDERIAALIDVNPRGLLDVFDVQKVYILIEPFTNELENDLQSFGWRILFTEYSNLNCKTRREAEQEAIKEAFKILNEKL